MVGWDGDYGAYGIFSESHKKKPQFDSSDGFGFVQFFDISLIFPNINMKKKMVSEWIEWMSRAWSW
jgi:hypothetical protein